MKKIRYFFSGVLLLLLMAGLTACGEGGNPLQSLGSFFNKDSDNSPPSIVTEKDSPTKNPDSSKNPGPSKKPGPSNVNFTGKTPPGSKQPGSQKNGTSGTTKPAPTGGSTLSGGDLEALRNETANRGDLCAVAYVGYSFDQDIASFLKTEAAQPLLEQYPFIRNIPTDHYVSHPDGGYEIYCIVPLDANASLTVNTWVVNEQNNYMGSSGQVLYRSESGEPILLLGNISEIVPSTEIVIVDNDGRSLSYNPSLSGMDGSLALSWEQPICDFTYYGDGSPFLGWWTAEVPQIDGGTASVSLNFDRNGKLVYTCYQWESEDYWYMEGDWQEERSPYTGEHSGESSLTLLLDTNTVNRGYGDDLMIDFSGDYQLSMIDETHFRLNYVEGDLLPGIAEQDSIVFELQFYF